MKRLRVAQIIVIVGLVAFAVRVVYVHVQTRFAPFDVSFVASDSLLYLRLAESLRSGQGFSLDGHPTAFVGPVYPLFLAVLGPLGTDPLAVGTIQSALGAATACLVAAIAARVAVALPAARGIRPESAAALAGCTCALYPHFVFWTGYLLTETLFAFLMASSVFGTMSAVAERRGRVAFGAGLLSALAALARPPYLAVGTVLILWMPLVGARRQVRWPLAVLFATGLALPMAAWTVRNVVELGGPVVTTTESGFVLYQANSAGSNGGSRGYLDGTDYVALEIPSGLSERERDALYLSRTLDDIRNDPATFIRRTGAKLWNMWRPTYEGSSVRNGAITLTTYVPLLVLGLVGALSVVRSAPFGATWVPLIGFCVWLGTHAIVGGMIRYRLPAELLLVPYLPFGLGAARTIFRRRDA